jgi:hypothetical protein
MNYVVMSHWAVGPSPSFIGAAFAGNLLAMLLFGLIIASIDQRRSR